MVEHVSYDPYASYVEPDHEQLAEIRGKCPVAKTDRGWFVTSYAAVKEVLQRIEDFRGGFSRAYDEWPLDRQPLSALDEERHSSVRKVINAAIGRRKSDSLEPFIRKTARALMDDVIATAEREGTVDIVETYAAPIASRSLAEALGVAGVDFDQFQRWGDELVDRMYDRAPAPWIELHPELAGSLRALMEAHRDDYESRDDYLSRLMQAGLPDDMVLTQGLQLVVAGNETTRAMIGNCFRRLAEDPDLYDSVRSQPELIPNLIEESLRFDPPIQVNGRFLQRDTELDGIEMKQGEHLVVCLGAANRDESVFESPNEFRLDRERPKDHLGFGAGPHVCPGAFLARHEGVVAVEEFVRRVAGIALADGDRFDGNPIFWSMAPLTLRLELTVT